MLEKLKLYHYLKIAASLYGGDMQMRRGFIELWLRQNPVPEVREVLDGRTTFEKLFGPLAQANLNIDKKNGTDEEFDRIASNAKRVFSDVLPLTAKVGEWQVNLTEQEVGSRKMIRSVLPVILGTAIIGGGLGMYVLLNSIKLEYQMNASAIVLGFIFLLSALMLWAVGFQSRMVPGRRRKAVPLVLDQVRELDRLMPVTA